MHLNPTSKLGYLSFNENPLAGLKGGRTRHRNGTWKCGILEMALKSGERKYAFSPSVMC